MIRETIEDIARRVAAKGGRALLVGGCVRDSLAGIEPKDFDIEVFGLCADEVEAALREKYSLDTVGKSFGVFKLHHHPIDVALPRRETKLGLGHRAFAIDSVPDLTLAEAAARRDFTINAIYRDPLTSEILDPHGGCADLERRILRHVSAHFSEDPLRVLRGMQFVARFDLEPDANTVGICRSMTPENLPPERLFDEWKKLLTKGVKISKGLDFLRRVGWVKYYPELKALIGCRQAPQWHPEGDVWNHTLCALDAFAKRREGYSDEENTIVGFAVLCHDFGKPSTSFYDRRKKRIRSLGHDTAGEKPAMSFLRRLTNEEKILKSVPPLVKAHMRPFSLWESKSGEAAIRRLAASVGRIDRLVRVCMADDEGRPPIKPSRVELEWLAAEAERLQIKDTAPKPVLMGRDLIELGMKPGVEFGAILKSAYEAQLDGKIKTREEAMEAVRKLLSRPSTYLLWDWNGTLLDDTRAAFDTLNIMLEKRGAKKIEMQFYLDNFSFPVRPFYEAIGMVLEKEDWNALAQEYHDIYLAQPTKRLNPRALEALAIAEKRVVGQSIISALRQDYLEEATEAYGVRKHMECVAGVDNLDGASKVERAKKLLATLRAAHPQVERFVLIGDAIHDKEVADSLGIECVLCGVGSHAAWRLRRVALTADDLVHAVELALGCPKAAALT